MSTNNKQKPAPAKSHDAAANALAREQAVAPPEIPVKQHNPDQQGLNPDQRGPAQPSDA